MPSFEAYAAIFEYTALKNGNAPGTYVLSASISYGVGIFSYIAQAARRIWIESSFWHRAVQPTVYCSNTRRSLPILAAPRARSSGVRSVRTCTSAPVYPRRQRGAAAARSANTAGDARSTPGRSARRKAAQCRKARDRARVGRSPLRHFNDRHRASLGDGGRRSSRSTS